MSDALRFRLGCPFWSFADWNGGLYSADARPGDRLRQYAHVFNTVEGNTTFYSTPSEATIRRWAEDTPESFRFCFKLPRELTHDRLLADAAVPAAAFFEALAPLGERLGAFLLQLPAAFGPGDLPALESFLARAPSGRRFAVELRHPAFFSEAGLSDHVDELLARSECDRVMMDTRALRAGDPRHPEVVAALHKKPDLPLRPDPIGRSPMVRFVGHPDDATNEPFLEEWAERLGTWLSAGLEPTFFVHTASNLRTPELARDLVARIARHRPVGRLGPFFGESGERASGQLALL